MHEIAWMSATKKEIYQLRTHRQISHQVCCTVCYSMLEKTLFLANWMLYKIKLPTPSQVWISTWKWFPTESLVSFPLWSTSYTTVDHVNLMCFKPWLEPRKSMFSGNFMEHLSIPSFWKGMEGKDIWLTWLIEFQWAKLLRTSYTVYWISALIVDEYK